MPPLAIPFRFFVSAPLFGMLGALLLLSAGAAGWPSRWAPAVMAATHFFTLGFMATVMLGALFQVLPVLSGHTIPGQRWLAPMVHLLISAGTLALGIAFVWPGRGAQMTALIMLSAGFALFIGALGLRLIRPAGGDSIFAIRLAALALLLSLGLGIVMLSGYLGLQIPQSLINPGIAHLRFALLGWVLLLIMGVSYQVIPMFHVTPDYPRFTRKLLPAAIFISLGVLALSRASWLTVIATSLLILTAGLYVVVTFYLFRQRKRKIVDYTIRFWQLGLSCLLLALLSYSAVFLSLVRPGTAGELQWGLLMIPGFAISIIIGMLYKIAPFLGWLHLQQTALKDPLAMLNLPTMRDLLPVRHARIQFRLHAISLVLLLGATLHPQITPLAAITLAADFLWLELSLLKVLGSYRRGASKIAA